MTRAVVVLGLCALALAAWRPRPKCPAPAPHAPSCAAAGCPLAPSGSCLRWEPCRARLCYCGNPPVVCDRAKELP